MASDMDNEQSLHDYAALSPDTMLDAVESLGYDCNGQFLALNSYENRVYRIGLEDGSQVVAKFYRPQRWSDEAILEEHQFTQELADEEIPVVAPLPINATTLHSYQGFRFTLFPWQGGRAFETDNADQLEQLGRFIARIHALGATKPFEHRPSVDPPSYLVQPASYILENDFLPDYLRDNYATLTGQLANDIEAIFKQTGEVQTLRLHADCHPGNILTRDGSPFIVDFDDARSGPAIQDLWMFLSGEREYRQKRLEDLLCGYEQFCEFNPAELQLIEPLRSLRMVHYAAWLAQRWDDPAFPQAFPWFNTAGYWEEHLQSLREQLNALQQPPLIW